MADTDAPTPAEEQPTAAVTAEDTAPETPAPEAVAPEVPPSEPEVPAAAPAPEPAPAPAPEPVATTPQVASTTEIPATPAVIKPPSPAVSTDAGSGEEGGEWELLVSKVQGWLASGQLQQQWQTARTPLSLLAGLIALLLVLRIYGALLAVLDSIPLLPGLLELAGLIAVVQLALTRMVRSSDRRQVIDGVRQRWQSFRGRS
jgi:hypothetical protein